VTGVRSWNQLWACTNPRALGPNVRGFVQAQSWFQDLTPVTVS